MDDGDSLAPVIPLFGGARGKGESGAAKSGAAESDAAASGAAKSGAAGTDAAGVDPRSTGGVAQWRSTWDAPMGAGGDLADAGSPGIRHPARGGERAAPRLRALESHETGSQTPGDPDQDSEAFRVAAEDLLVRKLRSRSLSVSEARMVLRGFERDERRLDASQVDDVIDDFCRRGYLDDAVLADHLVTSGSQRKGQGRVALSRALAQRGIPRDVIDAALDELPDDDRDRALEYARSKAQSLARLDEDTALRRLTGQLARRGYNGSVAMTAAKTALREASFGRPGRASGVRFVDSD